MLRSITGFAVRRPIVVILAWVTVLAAGFGIGTGVFESLTSDTGVVPGSESAQAEERVDHAAPQPDTITAVITGPASPAAVDTALADVAAQPGIESVSPALPSQTGDAVLVEVALSPGLEDDGEEEAAAAAERLESIDATSVVVAGGPLSDVEFSDTAQEDVARAEMLSMPVVLILLLVVFGGVLAAGLPLLIAIVGVGSTFGILFTFSQVTDVSVYSIQITTMLAVGLAVDYALLMVSRFREERRTTTDVHEAVLRTSATAGRTVVFSGLTVAVALAGLVVFNDPFLRSMGLAGSAVVLADMAAALTLLPALLAKFGHRISPSRERSGDGVFARVARAVQKRPVLTLVTTAAALVTLAVPVADMHISQGDPRMLPTSTDTRELWTQLGTHFPEQARWAGDIEIVASAPAGEVEGLRSTVEDLPGIASVEVVPMTDDLTGLTATPSGHAEGEAAKDAVRSIRDLDLPFEVLVGGDTAILVDYQAMLADRLPWAIALVAFGTLTLLFAFTGSILLPIKAILTNLLSIGASLGVVVWVFQQGHFAGLVGAEGLGYLHLTVPILVGAIAFGLSVDYEVFLLSRIRERWLAGDGAAGSVVAGLQRTGGIVTAAALIIGVVFAGFMFGGFAPIKAIGLGLVLAIALDAIVVRMLLVPATMTLLGSRNWWLPRRLRRVHERLALTDSAPEPESAEARMQQEPALVR
ncbi:MMPL family transporter [Jiangella alkaliphila]|uniref:Putative drug exporter of the RND superfamily n=1 Tax=Jiangella alkaliphila TaxID=419479 RepID=A0A1H2HQZ4_9ACTN|nr:MMPL family transporter [Jiangella alkaliphila]SDU34313.1 putative drug exporter of the RND superfamily [Jiangella alkaliphila]